MQKFKKIFLITCLTAFFGFSRTLISPILSPYAKSLGFTNFQISIIFSLFAITVLFASPIIGKISDSVGRRKVIFMGLLASVAAMTLYILDGTAFFVFARIFEAIGAISVGLISFTKLEDMIRDRERGTFTGFNESINTIGYILGPLAGGLLADKFAVKTPFMISIILLLLLVAALFFWKEEGKRKMRSSDFNFLKTFKNFYGFKELRIIMLLGFFLEATIPLIYVFVPLFIIEELGKSYSFVGYFMFVYFFFFLFQFAFGKISDFTDRRIMIVISALVSGVLLFFYSFSFSYALLLLLTLARSFANANYNVNTWSYLSSIGERKKFEGQAAGSYYALTKTGALFSYFLSSILVLFLDIRFLFIIYGSFLILAALIAKRMFAKTQGS